MIFKKVSTIKHEELLLLMKYMMLTYCLFVYLDLIGGSFMAFYQKQIRNNHVNITSYSHILKNIQDCYNATRLKRRLDELQETTVEFTDDTSPGDASAELPTQLDIDMGLVDEAQDLDDGNFLFEEESGHPDSINLDTIQKYGKKQCGYEHLTVPCCPNESVLIGQERDSLDHFQPLSFLPNRDVVSFTKLVQLSFMVDTSRHINPQHKEGEPITHLSVVKPNGTKHSIIEWGKFYGLDAKQQGAFEVAASNFVLTYHVDAENRETTLHDSR